MTVEELIEKASRLTDEEIERLRSAWFDRNRFRDSEARKEALRKSSFGERNELFARLLDASRLESVLGALCGAVLALAFRDRISEEHFNTLYGPWASVMER